MLFARVLVSSLSFALSSLFGDAGESAGTAIALVTMFGAVLWLVTAIVLGWQEFRSQTIYDISRRAVRYFNVTDTNVREHTVALVDITSVQVAQNCLGRFLGYGHLTLSTREQSKAVIFQGLAQPYEFKKRVEDLLEIAVPKAVDAPPLGRANETASTGPPRKRGLLSIVTPAIVIVAIVALLAWIIMPPTIDVRPGESRDVFLEADYVLTHGDLGWTDSDTENLDIRVSAPDMISVSVDSMHAVLTKIGEGQSIGFQYTARVQVSPNASVGEAAIYIRITHPKLTGPSVSQPPIRKIRVRIRK